MRSLFGYQRGGPVRGGAYREQPNLPSRGDPVQTAVDAAVGGGTANQYGFTSNLPSGSAALSRVVSWVNKETGETYDAPNSSYKPPPGSAWEQAPLPTLDFDFNQPDPVQDAVDAAMGGAGAGGDPTTDFAPVNNPFEPVERD